MATLFQCLACQMGIHHTLVLFHFPDVVRDQNQWYQSCHHVSHPTMLDGVYDDAREDSPLLSLANPRTHLHVKINDAAWFLHTRSILLLSQIGSRQAHLLY